MRVAQSIVVPSCRLTAVVDGNRDRVHGASRFDVAEGPIKTYHGVRETSRLIAGKPADVSLIIDAIKSRSERAGKADIREDAVLPDESVRRRRSFRRNAADAHGLAPLIHLDDGGPGRTGRDNGRENFLGHDEAVPSRWMLRIVAVNAAQIASLAEG